MTKQAVEGSSTGIDGETLVLHRCEGSYPPSTPVGGRWKQYFHAEGFFVKSSDGIARLMSISTQRAVVGSTSLLNSDFLLCVSASGGTATITLPSISTSMNHQFAVVKIDSSANPVVVTRAGSDTIEGATTKTISAQYGAVWLDNDGTSIWYVLAEKYFANPAASSFMIFSQPGNIASGVTRYYHPGSATLDTAEIQLRIIRACTVAQMGVNLRIGATAGKVIVWTLRKNGADTTQTVSITGANLYGSDSANPISFAVGDLLSVKVVTPSATGSPQDSIVTLEVY